MSNKGFKLADDRLTSICDDSVKVDTLIGADFYVKFVSPYLAKKQLYGMWCDFSTWGEILLSGRIPGSTSSPNQSVNMACLYHIGSPSNSFIKEDVRVLSYNTSELNSAKSLDVNDDNNLEENLPAEKLYTSKHLYLQNSSPVSVASQSKLNCSITSYSNSKFVNPFSSFCSNMSTFSNSGVQVSL